MNLNLQRKSLISKGYTDDLENKEELIGNEKEEELENAGPNLKLGIESALNLAWVLLAWALLAWALEWVQD